MQIQTIEQKTGLDRATIRYYEQEGLISPQRLQNGYRDYSEKHLQDLMKIKLLRQLGLSLEAIQQLIEGEDCLNSVLKNQLIVLKEHKAQIENAEAICKMIVDDNVTYQTIEPNKYYGAINQKKQIECDEVKTQYTEYVYLESHPVRRYVGRYLDQLLTSAILMLVFVVLLRIRPFGKVQNSLLSIASLFLSMPLNALFLCLFGTTPGKFVVGIFLKTPEGGNLSFTDALKREWTVFRFGMGYNIPIYNLVRLIKSYNIHTAGRELEWDYDADVLYTEWDTKRGVISTVFGILCAIVIGCASFDAQLPKYRTTDLTLAQFAENYNAYAKMNSMETYLSAEGEWYTPNQHPNSVVVDFGDSTEYWQFKTNEDQVLEQISVKGTTSSKLFATGKISHTIQTLILSQPSADILAADEAVNALSELALEFQLGTKTFTFGEIVVKIECEQLAMIYSYTVDIFIP